MKKLIIAMAVLVVAAAGSAVAQNKKNSGSTDTSDRPVVQAPVGHRQPRASDVPDERNLSSPNDAMDKEDAALDRKIKSICRGC
jgi:hypothetical protein